MNAVLIGAPHRVETMQDALDVALWARTGRSDMGVSFDALLRFLKSQLAVELRRNQETIDMIFRGLGLERAIRMTSWLSRHAENVDAFLFWELTELWLRSELEQGALVF